MREACSLVTFGGHSSEERTTIRDATVVLQAGAPTRPLNTFLGPAKPAGSRVCTRGQVLHDPEKCVSSNFVHVQHLTVSVQCNSTCNSSSGIRTIITNNSTSSSSSRTTTINTAVVQLLTLLLYVPCPGGIRVGLTSTLHQTLPTSYDENGACYTNRANF